MALCAAAAAAAAAAKAAAVWLATRAKLVEVEVVTAAAAEAPPQVIPPATGHAREKEQEQSFSCSIVETSKISQHFSVKFWCNFAQNKFNETSPTRSVLFTVSNSSYENCSKRREILDKRKIRRIGQFCIFRNQLVANTC